MTAAEFLASVHPWESLSPNALESVAADFREEDHDAGEVIYRVGDLLDGLYVVRLGQVEITDTNGGALSTLGARNAFGERGLMRDGIAATTARATARTRLLLLPASRFYALIDSDAGLHAFFARARPPRT